MKIVSNYGFQKEIVANVTDQTVEKFSAKMAFDKQAIKLTWGEIENSDVDEIRLVRKKGSYPLSIDDGRLLLVGLNQTLFIDEEVEPLIMYYYTMFSHRVFDNKYVFSAETMAKAFTIKVDILKPKLWQWLPSVYRRA